MANPAGTILERPSPWTGIFTPGAHGNVGSDVPVVITPLRDVSAVSVIARKDAKLPAINGLDVPAMGRWVANDTMRIASDGPNQWRVTSNGTAEGDLYRDVKAALGTTASVIDQSHGWVNVEIMGPTSPDVLAKGSSVDFHLDQFGAGQCAATQIHHMMVHVTCLDEDGPRYAFQLFRSMAGSFANWLRDSSAEFGCRIE